MIILDASVLIAHLRSTDVHHEDADRILGDFAESAMGASTITLAEVLAGPAAHGRLQAMKADLQNLDIREVYLGDDAATQLAIMRAETRLKIPDCCVLLAAEQVGADTVATFDDRLATVARNRGLAVAE